MRAVTIKEAKAKLNELIDAAAAGEDVVILRGSEHVAAIVPITERDIELSPRITDAQARRLWQQLEAERAAGRTTVFDSVEDAVAFLRSPQDGASMAREPRAKDPGRVRGAAVAKPKRQPEHRERRPKR